MGFSLRCAIAKASSPDEAARLHNRVAAAFPRLHARVFHAPFLGVICGVELSATAAEFHAPPENSEFDGEEEPYAAFAFAPSCTTRSHLCSATTTALPRSKAIRAMRWS